MKLKKSKRTWKGIIAGLLLVTLVSTSSGCERRGPIQHTFDNEAAAREFIKACHNEWNGQSVVSTKLDLITVRCVFYHNKPTPEELARVVK